MAPSQLRPQSTRSYGEYCSRSYHRTSSSFRFIFIQDHPLWIQYLNTPVLRKIQLCDVCLEERGVAVVTVVLFVLHHKVFHEIHGSHVFGFGQQVAGEATAQTQGSISYKYLFLSAVWWKTTNTVQSDKEPLNNWTGALTLFLLFSSQDRWLLISVLFLLIYFPFLKEERAVSKTLGQRDLNTQKQIYFSWHHTRCQLPAPAQCNLSGRAAWRGSPAARSVSAPGHESPTSSPPRWHPWSAPSNTLSCLCGLWSTQAAGLKHYKDE